MSVHRCSCGRQHVAPPDVQAEIVQLGSTLVVVTVDGCWRVPRIYLAVHGLHLDEAAMLAERLGWKPERRPKMIREAAPH